MVKPVTLSTDGSLEDPSEEQPEYPQGGYKCQRVEQVQQPQSQDAVLAGTVRATG